jgi:hypothetical protein
MMLGKFTAPLSGFCILIMKSTAVECIINGSRGVDKVIDIISPTK